MHAESTHEGLLEVGVDDRKGCHQEHADSFWKNFINIINDIKNWLSTWPRGVVSIKEQCGRSKDVVEQFRMEFSAGGENSSQSERQGSNENNHGL